MSLRRLKRMAGGRKRSISDKAARQLQQAHDLLEEMKWVPALELLSKLNEQHPNHEDIIAPLALAHYHLNELPAYLSLCIQLNKLQPDDPEHRLPLASAYLMNRRIALALLTLDRFLKRWPKHPDAGKAREMFGRINEGFDKLLRDMNLTGDDAYELAARHEEVQVALEAGDFKEGIAKGEALLRRKPDFKSVYNNLSMMRFYSGEIAAAIADAEQALRIKPGDFHALSNLTRYLLVAGREADARRCVEELKAGDSVELDRWVKQAEGCATIGDDEGVLTALDGAEAREQIPVSPTGFLVYHLAGVAALRLGREDEARSLWHKCLELSPAYEVTRENLADSHKPAPRRDGPWSFLLNHWIANKTVNDLSAEIQKGSKRGETSMGLVVSRFLQKHPEVLHVIPILLERGDPSGRQFAIKIATWARTPETLQMLADFALSQHGPDELRLRIAHEAKDLGAPLSGILRLWHNGKWQDMKLHTTEVTAEPKNDLSPEIAALLTEASSLLDDGDGIQAEAILKRALELAPDTPQVLNNLALAYRLQRRDEEADALLTQLCDRHPDYFFSRIHMSHRLAQQGKIAEAEEMLKPISTLERMHASEAVALYNARISLELQRGEREAAQSWLDLLEKTHPDDPNIGHWRSELKRASNFARLLSTQRGE